MLTRAMSRQIKDTRNLRTANITFAGPLLADLPFAIEVEILKEGKTKGYTDDEANVLQEFLTSIRLNLIRDKNAYLLTQLLEDWIRRTRYSNIAYTNQSNSTKDRGEICR